MRPNPVLKRLGYSDTDRVVIFHTDDIGMCQASIQAYADLWEFGTISSGAVMIPCPWAKSAAEYFRKNNVDMGVHVTLTAEWETYRWRAISTLNPESGLIDPDGFLYKSVEEAQRFGDPEAVSAEINAQVRKAREWGIDITHIDTHMGTVASPKFISAYFQAAVEAGVPAMIPRPGSSAYQNRGLDPTTISLFTAFVEQIEEQGIPLVDEMVGMPLDQPEGQLSLAKSLLGSLKPGITHFLFHPSTNTPELQWICPDWKSRVANYETFMSKEIKEYIRNSGIHVIGYRDLRKLMPR